MMELALKRWQEELKELRALKQADERRDRPVTITTEARSTKAPDLNQIVQAGDLSQRFWRLWDALHDAVWGILEDSDEADKVTAVGESVNQFRDAIMAWVSQAVSTGLFEDKSELEALKRLIKEHFPPLPGSADPASATPQAGDPANIDPASPAKSHLPDEVHEILSGLRKLSGYVDQKALERELRAFGEELRRKGA